MEASSKTGSLLEIGSNSGEEPVWLITTTKKHIAAQKRLKPYKIFLPHSLNTSPTLSICLITPDPQRAFKDVVAHASFPKDLSSRITRIIDIKKLEKKYHSFESKRQLMDSYDLFLADDRIVTYLPKSLGKTFYTSTLKRPIPVSLQPSKTKEEKRKNAALPSSKPKKNDEDPRSIVSPPKFAKEIERTLQMTMINLTPSATTAVRVGLASLTPDQLAENIEAVAEAMVEKFIPKKWKGVKAVHIKGPNSIALPIWLAEEMWGDEGEVLEGAEVEQARIGTLLKKTRQKMLESEDVKNSGKKRGTNVDGARDGEKSRKRRIEDGDLGQEIKERREKLRQQKKEVRENMEGEKSKTRALAVS